jgi:sphingolipid 4-desaturase/C4-monooxygenase
MPARTRATGAAASSKTTVVDRDDAKAPASAEVGYFQAEAPVDARDPARKRQPKMVKVTGYSMKGELPEQGSWHQERKQRILKAHPEVQQLYGNNPWSAAVMACSWSAITYLALRSAEVTSWPLFVLGTYTIGAVLSWQCATMAHEGTHKLVFKSGALNKLMACIALMPVFFGPFGNYWAVEHMYHHQVVVDKMQRYGSQQSRPLRKAIGALIFFPVANVLFFVASLVVYVRALLNLAAYTVGLAPTPFPTDIRMPPYHNFPQAVNGWYVLNTSLSLAYYVAVFALGGYKPVLFLYLSGGFANGLHPLGMRQVQEHYIQRRGQPTYSVYSIFNPLLLNLGFHVEHHDFPQIPWNRLPALHRMAPEFYDKRSGLFAYGSYVEILYQFLFTPGIPTMSLLEDYQTMFPAALLKAI